MVWHLPSLSKETLPLIKPLPNSTRSMPRYSVTPNPCLRNTPANIDDNECDFIKGGVIEPSISGNYNKSSLTD